MAPTSGPSPHLSWHELACHDRIRTPYPIDWRSTRAVKLAAVFEALRIESGGRPLIVRSAYRTCEYNRAIGGAPRSQHCEGRALDLTPAAGFTPIAFFLLLHRLATSNLRDVRGLGLYGSFVHLDIRPTHELVLWRETTDGLAVMTAANVAALRETEAAV